MFRATEGNRTLAIRSTGGRCTTELRRHVLGMSGTPGYRTPRGLCAKQTCAPAPAPLSRFEGVRAVGGSRTRNPRVLSAVPLPIGLPRRHVNRAGFEPAISELRTRRDD